MHFPNEFLQNSVLNTQYQFCLLFFFFFNFVYALRNAKKKYGISTFKDILKKSHPQGIQDLYSTQTKFSTKNILLQAS